MTPGNPTHFQPSNHLKTTLAYMKDLYILMTIHPYGRDLSAPTSLGYLDPSYPTLTKEEETIL